MKNKYTKIGIVSIEPPAPNKDKIKPISKAPIIPNINNYKSEMTG